ncbi:cytochrome P450 [Syncephalis fuscata]|nr:cytochrome P450 [Syncephalis fuscata]
MSKIPGPPFVSVGRLAWIYKFVSGQFDEYLYDMSKRYGKVIRVDLNFVAITDRDDVKLVLGSTKFAKSDLYHSFDMLCPNIFSTQDIILHRKLKHMIGPVFSMQSVAEIEPLVHKAGTEPLIKRLESYAASGVTFDIMEMLYHTALDVIGEISFGGTFNALNSKPGKQHSVIEWVSDVTYLGIMKDSLGPLCNSFFFPRFYKSEKLLLDFARSIIENRIKENIKESGEEVKNGYIKDVLQRLLESEDSETGEKFDIKQLISESIVQLVGGTDTIAITLTWWGLHLLDKHPKYGKLLKNELIEAFPDPQQTIIHNDVKNLTYLNATIWEILRVRPVAPGTQRKAPKGGAVISGYHISEGTIIMPSFKAIHNDTEIYGEDAEEFNPDRWIKATPEQHQKMRQHFLAFSMGSRACIGQNLAWMELRLLLANLMRRFDYNVPAGAETDMTPVTYFTLQPRGRKYLVQVKPSNV